MITGLTVTMAYMIWTIDIYGNSDGLWNIPETGFGTIGMLINFAVTIVVSQFTKKPSPQMQELVEEIRYPGRTQLVAAHQDGEV
jgi:cation/acetate symporter